MTTLFEDRIKKNLERVQVWERKTLGDRFDDFVKMYHDRDYVVTKERSFTYGETGAMVNRLAKGLIKIGIRNREHVGQIMANYPEAVFTKFAVPKVGGVNVPFNYRMLSEEMKYVLHQSDSVCLITMDEWGPLNYIDMLKQLCPTVFEGKPSGDFPLLRKIIVFSPRGKKYEGTVDFYDLVEKEKADANMELAQIQNRVRYPDEVVDILYTSGTTGKPKGVMLTHDMLWRKSYCSLLGRAIEEGRRVLMSLPLYHVFGLVEGVLATPWVGGAIVLQISWDPVAALDLIQSCKATDILCVPTMGLDLLNVPEMKKYDLSSLTAMYCAGAPAPMSLWERLIKDLGLDYLNTGYGMTETTSAPIQSPYYSSLEEIATRAGVVIPGGAAGLPEYGGKCVEYKTIDPFTGKDLPSGEEGEWACRGNVVAVGYYKKPVETAEVLDKDGWLRSGDLGIIHEDGFFEISGRSKELYRCGGENVSPKEIEESISRHPKVNQVYVVGLPDERMGEVGMAFIELKTGEACTQEQIIDYCKGKLARFKVPKYVMFVQPQHLPKTTTGKIQKYKLQEIGKEHLGI